MTHLDAAFDKFRKHGGTSLSEVLQAAEQDGCTVIRPRADIVLFPAACPECELALSQCACGPRCVMCGALDNEESRVTVRSNDDEGDSEPLCAKCWYDFDHRDARRYCDMQFAFYAGQDTCF